MLRTEATAAFLALAVGASCGGADLAVGEASTRAQAHEADLPELPGDALLPDIEEEPPKHLAIQNEHQRTMLRFTTTHWNTGAGHLRIRGDTSTVQPCESGDQQYDTCTFAVQEILNAAGDVVATHGAGVSVFHPEHNHWHQNSVVDFRVQAGTPDGPTIAAGLKTTFCLIDFDKSDLIHENRERVYWECNGDVQGISPGWGDEYHQSTEGQELDITDAAPGIYYLTHLADPDQHWLESNEDNNFTWTKFRLYKQGGNMKITDIEYGPCEGMTCGNKANK